MSSPGTDRQTRPPVAKANAKQPRTSAATAVRLLARRVHFLAGIAVAPFLAVLCLTGLVYAFSPQIHDDLYHSQLYANEPDGSPRPVSEQVRAALAAHPEGALRSVITPSGPGRTTQVVLSVPGLRGVGDGAEGRTVFVDPYTNYINGELTTVGNLLPANVWLRQLHSNLHLGEPGRLYAELAASWLPLIILGGLVVWLAQPRRRKRVTWRELLVPTQRGAPEGWARLRGVHGPLGLWLAVGLLVLGVTGLAISQFAGGRSDQAANPLHLRAPTLTAAPVQVPTSPSAMPEVPPPVTPSLLPETPRSTSEAAAGVPETSTAEPEPPSSTPETPPSVPETTTVPGTTPPEPTTPETPSREPERPSLLPTVPPLLPSIPPELPSIPLGSSPVLLVSPTFPASASPVRISIDHALAVARAAGLGGEVIVTPPNGDGGVFTVAERSVGLPIQRDSIAIDPYTAQVAERIGWADYSFAAKLTTLSAEFHTGTLFGLANQLLLAVLAIGLLVLIGLGYRMWWVHNPYRGKWAALPPPVWRQLSRPALVLVLLTVVALSWVLPVLGISLVAFVALDSVINAVRRRRAGTANR
ncbi:PepSY domain-containing protein [Saccharopolyspora sp. K220]|uniref:PepSY-associated TM helix domain-containing protein n=1 Tax=Saccharopolyspora soli TaxID=2926618 RepID=UPI001F575370|nr:PepSY domain-containing protein [Saccharopolyspora soli]MCI2415851.1 PepSY domain-containing protein [Saccharopolyspora soli]